MQTLLLHAVRFAFLFLSVSVYSETTGCEVLNYITHCDLRNNKLTETDSFVIQINDRSGEKYTIIEIPYSNNSKVSDIEGWIEDATGKIIRKIKKSDISDKSAISDISMYEDHFVKTFQLKHNTYPYRIFYSFKTTQNQYLEIAYWTPVVYQKVPTRKAELFISFSKNIEYKKFVRGVTESKADTLDDVVQLKFFSKYDKAEQEETFAEPYQNIEPSVIIVPNQFIYGVKGSSENWKSFGNWIYNLNQNLNDLPESELNTISNLIKNIPDKKEKIKTLYHYLQDHTRYVNVSIGIGGLKSYPASYVSYNKYGDCKALTNFMKSLLESAGIKSNILIIDRDFLPVNLIEEIPFSQFNHVLLLVPLENDTLYLENTNNTTPFGYVGTDIQNRKALVVEENNSRLIKMPALTKNSVVSYRTMQVSFDYSENATVQAVFLFRGYDFELFNELNTDYNLDEQDRFIRDYMPFTNYEVLNWRLRKFHRDSAQIELISKINLSKFLLSLGSERYCNLFRSRIPDFKTPSERETPVFIPYPLCTIDSIFYKLPSGFQVKSFPAEIKISTQYGNYELSAKTKNNSFIIIKSLELFPARYSLEQYKEFYNFLTSIKNVEKQKLVFKRPTSSP